MTKNKRAAYAVTILILLAILIAITAVLSVMSKRLNKLTAEKDYLIIGIEDPATGDPVYDDFSLTLSCDDATDFSLVLRNVSRGEFVEPESLGISADDFSCSLKNLNTSETLVMDGDWPAFKELDPVYNAYELKIEYIGSEVEGYFINPVTLTVIFNPETYIPLKMFEEESIYVYPGEKRTYSFTPEYGTGNTVFKTYGDVEHTLTVSDGTQVLYSGGSAKENVCSLEKCSTVYLTFTNDSTKNEAFCLSAGYISLSDYIDDPDGISFTLQPSEVFFLQIDPDVYGNDRSKSSDSVDILNIVAESNVSLFDIEVRGFYADNGNPDDSLYNYMGCADGFRLSLFNDFKSVLIFCLTNNSKYEKTIDCKLFSDSGTKLSSTVATPKIFTIGIESMNKLLVDEPGQLTITFDSRMTEMPAVFLYNESGEVTPLTIASFATEAEVTPGVVYLVIKNAGTQYFSASFTFKAQNT